MKKLSIEEIYDQLNEILVQRKLIPEALDFNDLSYLQAMVIIYDSCKLLEYKLYYKGQKKSGIYLRKIYTLCEKLSVHEKRRIQEFKFLELDDDRVIYKNEKKKINNLFRGEINSNEIELDDDVLDDEDLDDEEDNIENLEKRLKTKDIMGDDILDDEF
jgi:hypothetical protein